MAETRTSDHVADVPAELVIGVTGHRELESEAEIADAVFRAFGLICRSRSIDPAKVQVTVVSALAEGADRIVVNVLGSLGAKLEVVLPLAPDDYVDDFGAPASKDEFRELLHLASTIVPPSKNESRSDAYRRVGREIVDRCDVLIAIWDGLNARGEGGTAEVVALARRRNMPLVWIESVAPHEVHEEPRGRVWWLDNASALDMRASRERLIRTKALRRRVNEVSAEWTPESDAVPSEHVQPLVVWIAEDFATVDLVASRYERRFKWTSLAIFALPVLAVLIATVQALFAPEHPRIALLEAGLLACLFALPWWSHWVHGHSRWISYRFLAERLRSAFFLAVAGSIDGADRDKNERMAYRADPSDASIVDYLRCVSALRPRTTVERGDVHAVRAYLAQQWIGNQIEYHAAAGNDDRKWVPWLRWMTMALAALAVAVSLVHAFSHPEAHNEASWRESLLIEVTIAIPLFGGFLHGLEAQREPKRHAERHRRMAELLGALQRKMMDVDDPGELAAVAAEVERISLEENSDWFGVVRFHDVELIT